MRHVIVSSRVRPLAAKPITAGPGRRGGPVAS